MHSNTDKYYDIIYRDWISDEQTQTEIKFFMSILPLAADILDIGAGTGRHLIPIFKSGKLITGLEPSKEKFEIIRSKGKHANIFNTTLKKAKLNSQFYDLAICMWNTVSEIAKTERELEEFLIEVFRIMKPGGTVVISTGDNDNFELQEKDFEFEIKEGKKIYKVKYKLLEIDKKNFVTKSLEHIQVYNLKDKLIDECQKVIVQRHWLQNELIEVGSLVGFQCQVISLPNSQEKYFIFHKDFFDRLKNYSN